MTAHGDGRESPSHAAPAVYSRKLILAKLLFFATAMASVGWQRFQNIFYLEQGLSPSQIGELKSLGLLLKFLGEPFWCLVADLTDMKTVFAFCILMQIGTMELLRLVNRRDANALRRVRRQRKYAGQRCQCKDRADRQPRRRKHVIKLCAEYCEEANNVPGDRRVHGPDRSVLQRLFRVDLLTAFECKGNGQARAYSEKKSVDGKSR
jgi:hypothetical protein